MRYDIFMNDFTPEEIDSLYRVMAARRDMRHFSSEPIDPALLDRLLAAANLAPSVGLMQPWRFIRVRDRSLRLGVHALVDEERRRTAHALGEREAEFMRLKVEGILECGELLVAALAPGREKHVFGRRTMPDMDLASVACAIQNLWLAARAEGIGMGWVSILTPGRPNKILDVPESWRFLGYFCVGYPQAETDIPELERAGWETRRNSQTFILRR